VGKINNPRGSEVLKKVKAKVHLPKGRYYHEQGEVATFKTMQLIALDSKTNCTMKS